MSAGSPSRRWAREALSILRAIDPQLDAESMWGQRPLLRALDVALANLVAAPPESGEPPESGPLARACGLALGEVLVRELTVEWGIEEDGQDEGREDREDREDGGREPVLGFDGSDVLLYPLRMVRAHVAAARGDGTPIRLERLVDSSGSYLDHLARYFPSRVGLDRRTRGSRRPRT